MITMLDLEQGTSPRMRGKHCFDLCSKVSRRNIPAYAGKTGPARLCLPLPPEHPRVCGENCLAGVAFQIKGGTSPRMRGKLTLSLDPEIAFRNIPAYAGKTERHTGKQPLTKEHPRVCGENVMVRKIRVCVKGTSPRMRGKLYQMVLVYRLRRNIPAYAGKTLEIGEAPPGYEEHPRVCGENRNQFSRPVGTIGTSPRMRGKPWVDSRP